MKKLTLTFEKTEIQIFKEDGKFHLHVWSLERNSLVYVDVLPTIAQLQAVLGEIKVHKFMLDQLK